MKSKNKPRWELIFKGQMEDFSQEDSLRYWSNQSTVEKFKEVANLIEQVDFIRNKSKIDGQKFLRATAVIKRL